MVRETSELESNVVAIERVKEYAEMSTEVGNIYKHLIMGEQESL